MISVGVHLNSTGTTTFPVDVAETTLPPVEIVSPESEPLFADGNSFASVLTPLHSPWSLFPCFFMVGFIFLWWFRAKFWAIHGVLEECVYGDANTDRKDPESSSSDFAQIMGIEPRDIHDARL